MIISLENTKEIFENKLKVFINAIAETKKHFVLNEKLQVVNKFGFRWYFLCLLRPFYTLFGKDVYSHVRAHRVAQSLFKYCEANKKYLQPGEIEKINRDILGSLDRKTKQKYHSAIQLIQDQMKQLSSLAKKENAFSNDQLIQNDIESPLAKKEENIPLNDQLIQKSVNLQQGNLLESPTPKKESIPLNNQLIQDQAKRLVPTSAKKEDNIPLNDQLIQEYTKRLSKRKNTTSVMPSMRDKAPQANGLFNLDSIGIPLEQQKLIKALLKEVISPSVNEVNDLKNRETIQSKWQILQKDSMMEEYKLVNQDNTRITILLFKNSRPEERDSILLALQSIEKEEEKKTNRLCYDLNTGDYFVEKRIYQEVEQKLISLCQQSSLRGIPKVFMTYTAHDFDKKSPLLYYMEPCFDGNLHFILDNSSALEIPNKFLIIGDLLNGIHFLHQQVIEIKKKTPSTDPTKDVFPFSSIKGFHFDINPDHILFNQDTSTGKWNAFISGFRLFSQVRVAGTFGFTSPQDVQFHLKNYPNGFPTLNTEVATSEDITIQEVFKHNNTYGQPRDMWALGLIFVSILAGKGSEKLNETGLPPLKCIEESLLNSNVNPNHPDAKIAELQQLDIDRDLETLKQESLSQVKEGPEANCLKQLWDLAGQLLRVSVEERYTAEKALAVYREIGKQFS